MRLSYVVSLPTYIQRYRYLLGRVTGEEFAKKVGHDLVRPIFVKNQYTACMYCEKK
jgi:hypothetical protein